MNAGRELDARIAELMGYKVVIDSDGMGETHPHIIWIIDGDERRLLPYYSTDIAAAWQIVELMVSKMGYNNLGFMWQGPLFKREQDYLTHEGYPAGTTCWYVYLEQNGMREWVCADTAPLAICRAALETIK